jgi:hypothetical protein
VALWQHKALAQKMPVIGGGVRFSFLSEPQDEKQQPAEETPQPQEDNKNFDGVWTFTSAGCPYTGSLPARIVGGKIIIRSIRMAHCIRSARETA